MKLSKTMMGAGLLAGLVMAMGGCASTKGDGFPDASKANPHGGTFLDLDHLRQYAPGMNKQQIQALLGRPQFNEGFFGVREWNYLFNLRRSVGAEPLVCQMRIDFNSDGIATGQAWKPAACATLLEPPAPPPPPPAPPAPAPEPVRLQTDALFDFDSAVLLPAGEERLRQMVAEAGDLMAIREVTVVGYTDRIGTDEYNLNLSQERAEAVSNYLVEQGVPASVMHSEGRGKADPVVQCEPGSSADVIACLAPNRRVEISGLSER